MRVCVLCNNQFDPQSDRKNSTPPFNCQICKLSSSSLYQMYTKNKRIHFDTTDVCWDCDVEILKQHNEYHSSVDLV